MAAYGRRLLIIISVTAILSLAVVWLSFNLNALHVFGQNRTLFLLLAVACIVPICFYYPMAKRMPRLAIGLAVLAGGLVLCSVYAIAYLVFNLDNIWIDGIYDLSQALFSLAGLIFIWQAVRKSRAENKETSRTGGG